MEKDRYPAVRQLAWRGLRRLVAPRAAAELLRRGRVRPVAAPAEARARSVSARSGGLSVGRPPRRSPCTAAAGRWPTATCEIGE